MEDILEVFIREGDDDTKVEAHSIKQLFTHLEPDEQENSSENEEEIYVKTEDTPPDNKSQKRRRDPLDDNTTKKRNYIQKYRKDWEAIPSYKPWLSASVLGNLYFYCKFCRNDNKCGKTEIEKHMVCKKHINNSKLSRNKVQKKFSGRGLLCPVFTSFINKEQDINFNVIPEYADYLYMCGIKGVLINDVIGEGMSLTLIERMKVTEHWVAACERTNQHLMVQVGGAPLKEVQEMVIHAEKKKVGSIVVLPDVYNKPNDHFDLMRYIKLVADFANTLPILYHHNPSATGVNINMQKFLYDMLGEVDNFVGIIFSDNNLHDAVSALQVNEDKFTVFMGTDEIILGALSSGFSSLVAPSLNYLPKLGQTIHQAVQVGNYTDATKTQKYLRDILETTYRYGAFVPAAKAAMNLLTPINVGGVRHPLVSIWQDKMWKLKTDFQKFHLTPESSSEDTKPIL